jgi:Ras family protein T1
VYRCHVIGPRDAGKTTFCQGILGKSRKDLTNVRPEDFPRHTINTIQVYGQEKYLVLEVSKMLSQFI